MKPSRTAILATLSACLITFAVPSAAAVNDRLNSGDPAVVRSAADEILRDPKTLKEPLILYQAALGLAVAGQNEQAAVMYLAARLRTFRQVLFEKGERPQLLGVMEMTISPLVMPILMADFELARRLVQRVIAWDRSTPDPFRDSATAKSGEIQRKSAEIDAALARLPDQIRDAHDGAALARARDTDAKRQIRLIAAERCGPGKPSR